MRHLLTAQQQESFLPFSSRQSLSCCLSRVAKRSTPKLHVLSPFVQSRLVLPIHSRAMWPSSFPLRTAWSSLSFQNRVALYLSTCFRTSWFSLSMAAAPRFISPRPSSFAAHFRLLLQSATPASIPVFFQLYWAATVSLGRCGPMAWSQSSPSSHSGPVTRGSYFLLYTLDGSHSHPPGSKQGHSYLTYP